MSSTINASTASGGGVITSADASGILQLQTAGVTALSISAAQVVSFTNPVASLTLTSATLTSATLTTPTIDSAQVPTVSGTAPLYMCRAWVNFNGTGTVAIRASGNVSSITDNGVGDYTVNFTTAMPDANYSSTAYCAYSSTSKAGLVTGNSVNTKTTSALQVFTVNCTNAVAVDLPDISVSIFR